MFENEAVAFFYEHAGFSYDPKTETPDEGRFRCARELAGAEAFAKAQGWYVDWERDHDAEANEEEYQGWPQYAADLKDADGELLESLSGIMFKDQGDENDDPYARVVAAELADQARKDWQPSDERPSFACAECGTTEATTYVVTTLDPENPRETQTEVCRQCDDLLRLDEVSA
jgi:hypothetical protein